METTEQIQDPIETPADPQVQSAPVGEECGPPPTAPVSVDPALTEFQQAYSVFQRDTVSSGAKVYQMWLKLWTRNLQNAFKVPVDFVNVGVVIPQGTPPQQIEHLIQSVKQAGKTIGRIEFDTEQKAFRLYVSTIENG